MGNDAAFTPFRPNGLAPNGQEYGQEFALQRKHNKFNADERTPSPPSHLIIVEEFRFPPASPQHLPQPSRARLEAALMADHENVVVGNGA
jgi:hypothetical protein